jgi:hypothetical protein
VLARENRGVRESGDVSEELLFLAVGAAGKGLLVFQRARFRNLVCYEPLKVLDANLRDRFVDHRRCVGARWRGGRKGGCVAMLTGPEPTLGPHAAIPQTVCCHLKWRPRVFALTVQLQAPGHRLKIPTVEAVERL